LTTDNINYLFLFCFFFVVIRVGVYVWSSTLVVTARTAPVEDGDRSVCVVHLAFMGSVILTLVR